MARGAKAHMQRAAFYSPTDPRRARWHTERARSLVTSFGGPTTWMGTTGDPADALREYLDLVESGGLTDDNMRMVLDELKGSIYSGAFIPLSNWNIEGVRDMSGLFEDWAYFNEQLHWETSHVKRFDAMFKGCSRLGQSRPADAFTVKLNFRRAESVRDMFAGCTNVHLIAEDASVSVQEELIATLGTRDSDGRGNRVTWIRSRSDGALADRNTRRDAVASSANSSMEKRIEARRGRAAIAYEARLAAEARLQAGAAVAQAREAAAAAAQAERQRRVASDVAGMPTCNVCYQNRARYVPPCGHALCGMCANGVLDSNALCHICRAPVTSDGYRQAFFFGAV